MGFSGKGFFYFRKISLRDVKVRIHDFLDSDKASAKTVKLLLAVVGLAGVLAVAMVAPNIFSITAGHRERQFDRSDQKYRRRISSAVHYAKNRGYVKTIQEDNKMYLTLTPQGENLLALEILKNLKICSRELWEGGWYLVIFDIPVKKNFSRDFFRNKLKQLNFYQLQESVFLFPWNCKKEIDLLRKFLGIEKYVCVVEVKGLEREEYYKKHFRLA